MKEASSFYDYPSANLTQARFIKENKREIEAWLENSEITGTFVKDIQMSRNIGIYVPRNGKTRFTNKAKVVLGKDNSELGYHVVTSYPVP